MQNTGNLTRQNPVQKKQPSTEYQLEKVSLAMNGNKQKNPIAEGHKQQPSQKEQLGRKDWKEQQGRARQKEQQERGLNKQSGQQGQKKVSALTRIQQLISKILHPNCAMS